MVDDRSITFKEFLTTQSPQIALFDFSLNLITAGFLAWVLSLIYVRYGNSISNRSLFAKNIIIMAVTTMVIITIVKSSLALSLGLVGALSVIRFRTAIKEPEELTYLFMSIAIGLGYGADQGRVVLISFIIIFLFIIIRNYKNKTLKTAENTSMFLTLSLNKGPVDNDFLSRISDTLSNDCMGVKLKRYDVSTESFEAVYQISLNNIDSIDRIQENLRKIDNNFSFNVLDEAGIVV